MKVRFGSIAPFLAYIRRQWPVVLLAACLALGVSALNLVVPVLFMRLTNLLQQHGAPAAQRMDTLTLLIGLLSGVFLARRVLQSLASYLATSVTQRMAVQLRRDVYRHLQRLPLEFYDDTRTGALVSSVTNDIMALQFLLHDGMVELFTAPVTVIGSVVLVFRLDPWLGAAALAVFPILYLVLRRTRHHLRRIGHENQVSLADMTRLFVESVANIRVVRAFCRQDYELERFEERNAESLQLRLRNARLNAVVDFLTEFTMLIAFAVILWVGGMRIVDGEIEFGIMVALVAYLQMMRTALNSVSIAYTRYQQATGAGNRLLELLHEPLPPRQEYRTVDPQQLWRGELRLRGVTFGYPNGHLVLDQAEALIRPGETVALVGESGAGKSTIASLVLGLYRPQAGHLELDGVPTDELAPELLLQLVSIVPQDVGLFSGSVRDNIAYARLDAGDAEIEEAARLANAHEFIQRLPEGYQTFVGDQGVKLSGGQRQRLAIARAILRNPRLLILDEATSHIDPETEALVQEALARLMHDRTTLVIAHQSSAMRDVDRVLELRQGKLHERAAAAPPA